MSELLTPIEAGDYLRVSRATVYNLMYRGELVGLHVGRRRLFTRAELDAFIAARSAAEPDRAATPYR